jgi:hypothetical protein
VLVTVSCAGRIDHNPVARQLCSDGELQLSHCGSPQKKKLLRLFHEQWQRLCWSRSGCAGRIDRERYSEPFCNSVMPPVVLTYVGCDNTKTDVCPCRAIHARTNSTVKLLTWCTGVPVGSRGEPQVILVRAQVRFLICGAVWSPRSRGPCGTSSHWMGSMRSSTRPLL